MRPYSKDLRQRVVSAYDRREGTQRQIARRFGIGLRTVSRWLMRRSRTGSLGPAPHGGGRRRAVDGADAGRLAELVRERPDATLDELNAGLGLGCSRMAIFRALRRLRISRKKKVLYADERRSPKVRRKRRRFARAVARAAADRLVFIDETGANTAMTRAYGRAPIGERVIGSVPGRWESVTLVTGVRLSGVVAPMAFRGALDQPVFEAYVGQILAPELRPGDLVVWDNLRPHQSRRARRDLRRARARLQPLPPYSPDLSPIEKMFSKVKQAMRSLGARTTTAVYEAMDRSLKGVTPQDIRGWFQACGLCPTQT